jgi:hypothetical protein
MLISNGQPKVFYTFTIRDGKNERNIPDFFLPYMKKMKTAHKCEIKNCGAGIFFIELAGEAC